MKPLPEILWALVLVAMVLAVRSIWTRLRAAAQGRDETPEPHVRWLDDEELAELRHLLRSDRDAAAIVDAVVAPRARLLRDEEIERLTAALDEGMPVDPDSPEWFAADDLMASIQPLSERFWR
jgi:hypothetical protein